MATALRLSLCFFWDAKFQERCFNIPEISFIQYFGIFDFKQYGVITGLICISEKNVNISKTKKRYFKKKNAILLQFERPFKWAENIFHVICTLKSLDK